MEKGVRICKITVTAGRKRLIDPDNICVKFALDAIKGAGGFIEDDSAKFISSLIVRQEKIGKGEKPYTKIEIEFEDN